ncbi:hypothetical protein CAC00_09655 [Raoultella ornithinolytica]|nr:hypothetical protein CAC00_09655 [Raoultella ornithinolytica]
MLSLVNKYLFTYFTQQKEALKKKKRSTKRLTAKRNAIYELKVINVIQGGREYTLISIYLSIKTHHFLEKMTPDY